MVTVVADRCGATTRSDAKGSSEILLVLVQSTLHTRIWVHKNNRFVRIKFLAPASFVWEIRISSYFELFLEILLSHHQYSYSQG